jgi:hypothetical protein
MRSRSSGSRRQIRSSPKSNDYVNVFPGRHTRCLGSIERTTQQGLDEDQSSGRKIVQDALVESRAIKVGMTRRDLEKHWGLDGGTSIREESRYIYLKCEYIRVDLKFRLVAPVHGMANLADDAVTEVSRPYLDYPTMD